MFPYWQGGEECGRGAVPGGPGEPGAVCPLVSAQQQARGRQTCRRAHATTPADNGPTRAQEHHGKQTLIYLKQNYLFYIFYVYFGAFVAQFLPIHIGRYIFASEVPDPIIYADPDPGPISGLMKIN